MRTIIACLMFAAAVPATANELMPQGQATTVARSPLEVTPTQDWNRLSARPGRNAETWTLDGELLNDVSFYGGTEDGRTLFREVDRRNRPLPRFQATMLPTDIPALLENSYRIAREVSIFVLESQEPVRFAGQAGIRFTYSFVGSDLLRRRGEAYAAIINGRLYMMSFEAPTIHYFERSIAQFRVMAASAAISGSGRRRR